MYNTKIKILYIHFINYLIFLWHIYLYQTSVLQISCKIMLVFFCSCSKEDENWYVYGVWHVIKILILLSDIWKDSGWKIYAVEVYYLATLQILFYTHLELRVCKWLCIFFFLDIMFKWISRKVFFMRFFFSLLLFCF